MHYKPTKNEHGNRVSNLTIIMWSLFLSPLIRPNGIGHIMPAMEKTYDYAVVLILLGLILYIAINNIKITGLILVTISFYAEIIIVSYLQHQQYTAVIRTAICSVTMILFVYALQSRLGLLIQAAFIDFEILIYVNAISLILYPDGMYLTRETTGGLAWIMGYDNHWFIFYYVAYYLAVARMAFGKGRTRELLLIIIMHLTALYTLSGVLIFGLMIMDFIYALKIYKVNAFSLKKLLVASILMSAALVFGYTNNVISNILLLIGKSNSILSRINIWTRALELIRLHPIFGSGRLYTDYATLYYGSLAAGNAHNNWLEVLVEGGLIAFCLYICIVLLVSHKIEGIKSKIIGITLVPVFVTMIMMAVDSILEPRGIVFYLPLTILYFAGRYSDSDIEKEFLKESNVI